MEEKAGFWIRLGAGLLDGLIIALPISLIVLAAMGTGRDAELTTNVLYWIYGIVVPVAWAGYTVGKRICGIRIRKIDGSAPTFGTMLLRTLVGGIVYAFTFGIGVIVSAFMVGLREDKRSIHDFIAGTEVVRSDMG